MNSKTGRLFMVLGILIILSSLGLLLYNRQEAKRAGESSADALAKVRASIKEIAELQKLKVKPAPAALPERPGPLASVEIDGYGYIGYLSIPSLGLELPVMDGWDYVRLNIAPCRQYGETTDKMIIAARNYRYHFGMLYSLSEGDIVYFTDMTDNITAYMVETVDTVGPNGFDALKDSAWNLVLYTSYNGRSRVMAGCRKM